MIQMLDYQFQHNSHVIDWRMFSWMRTTPRPPHRPSDWDYQREWQNYQSQRYHGWIHFGIGNAGNRYQEP